MRMHGTRKRIYLLTCNHPVLNRKALRLCRSLDEIREILNRSRRKPHEKQER